MSNSQQKILFNRTNVSLPKIHNLTFTSHSNLKPFFNFSQQARYNHSSLHNQSNTRIPETNLNQSQIVFQKQTYKKQINKVAHLHNSRLQFYKNMLVDLNKKQIVIGRTQQNKFNIENKLRSLHQYNNMSKEKRKIKNSKKVIKKRGHAKSQEDIKAEFIDIFN